MKIELDTNLMVLRDGEPVGASKDFLSSLIKDTSLDGWQARLDPEELDDAIAAAPPEEQDRLMPYLILYRLIELYESRAGQHALELAGALATQREAFARVLTERDAAQQSALDALQAKLDALTAPPERTPEEQEAFEVEQRAQAMLREARIQSAAAARFKALAAEAGLALPAEPPTG